MFTKKDFEEIWQKNKGHDIVIHLINWNKPIKGNFDFLANEEDYIEIEDFYIPYNQISCIKIVK